MNVSELPSQHYCSLCVQNPKKETNWHQDKAEIYNKLVKELVVLDLPSTVHKKFKGTWLERIDCIVEKIAALVQRVLGIHKRRIKEIELDLVAYERSFETDSRGAIEQTLGILKEHGYQQDSPFIAQWQEIIQSIEKGEDGKTFCGSLPVFEQGVVDLLASILPKKSKEEQQKFFEKYKQLKPTYWQLYIKFPTRGGASSFGT